LVGKANKGKEHDDILCIGKGSLLSEPGIMDVSTLCGRGSVTTITPEIRNLTPNSSLKLVEKQEKIIKISSTMGSTVLVGQYIKHRSYKCNVPHRAVLKVEQNSGP
jgi:hypothetical protein